MSSGKEIEVKELDNQSKNTNEKPVQSLYPPNLKKTFICSASLLLIGISLFILGFIEQVASNTPGDGILMWCLGIIVCIPGGYYSYQFYRARKAVSQQEKEDIFEEIPQI